MAKKYYWLKLKEDFFRDKKIKKLRKIAGGDTYTIIYLKMQLLSLKNDGALLFEGVEDNFAEEIALEIDEDIENVKVTIAFLMGNGLIEELGQDHFVMTETIQCIGSEGASAERVRKHRELKKKQEEIAHTEEQKVLPCNAPVTNSNIEIEKREKRKELENKSKSKEYYANAELNSLFIEFLEVRKKLKAVNSERAINTLIKTLNNYDDDTKYKMIENSIVNSWKSVYELKPNKTNASNNYKRVEEVPEWLNKEIKGTKATKEEQAEMEELLKEFRQEVPLKLDFETRKAALQERLRRKYKKKEIK